MWVKIIVVLAIIPWSLLGGLAYLAYRRVRGQRAAKVPASAPAITPFDYSSAKEGWQTADADYIARVGRA